MATQRIGSNRISNLAVTGDKITNYSVTGEKLSNTAITDSLGYTAGNESLVSSSFDHANGAFARANTTAETLETAYSHANGAFLAANTALATSVDSFARDHANGAFDKANTAITTDGGTISGSLSVEGNLTVTGTTTTVSANNLIVQDNMIYLNAGDEVNNVDLGFSGNYNDGTYAHAGLFRDATDGNWKFFDSYLPEPAAQVDIDTSNNSFTIANVQANFVTSSGNNIAEQFMVIALSDEENDIETGTAKVSFRAPYAMTLYQIPRASLTSASSSGAVTVDINENGTSILSTKLTIDAGETTSTTAATPAVLSDTAIADDALITIDIDGAGTSAVGLKVVLYYKRV